MKLSSLRRLEKRVRKVTIHEASHGVAFWHMKEGAALIEIAREKTRHGGEVYGHCYEAKVWREKDRSNLGSMLDYSVGLLAGVAGEFVCGLHGGDPIAEREVNAYVATLLFGETSDYEKHFHLTLDMYRRFPEFRRAVGDGDFTDAAMEDAMEFLTPHRQSIEALADALTVKFWESGGKQGYLLSESIQEILGCTPSGMLSVQEAARLLGIHRKRVPQLPGVVTFSGVLRVPASLFEQQAAGEVKDADIPRG